MSKTSKLRALIAITAWLAVFMQIAPAGASPWTAATTSAALRAPSADPQCTGIHIRSRNTDAVAARRLMSNRVTLAPFRAAAIPNDPRWTEDPFGARNWVFQYQTLRWVDVLRREGMRTHDRAMLDRYLFLLRDWIRDDAHGRRSRFAWYDMTVGVRALTLVCATQVAGDAPWLVAAMKRHAMELVRNYRVVGNHALHQNIGLLAIGCHLRSAGWRRLAVRRTAALISRSVDEQGVTDEGSVEYQYLNYLWYSEVEDRMRACGLKPQGPFERVALMPVFLAHATRPDGTPVGIGDSDPRGRPLPIKGTVAEFAATRGTRGPAPWVLFKTYKRGYAFSRSGWSTGWRWVIESFMTLRYGEPVTTSVHGHADAGSITFSALGTDLLWEQGHWGGMGSAGRQFLRHRTAHNVIDIPGATYLGDRDTPLIASENAEDHHLVTIRNTRYQGATWTRTAMHVLDPGFLVVDDVVTQARARNVVQRWYVGPDRSVRLGSGRAGTSGSGANATFLWAGDQPRLSTVRGQVHPMLGWRSERPNSFEPATAIQASAVGRTIRMTTVIVPRAANANASAIRLGRVTTTASARTIELWVGGDLYVVRLMSGRATVDKFPERRQPIYA